MPKERLPHDVFQAVLLYVKYRFSHKTREEQFKIRKKTISLLRQGGEEAQQKYLRDVGRFEERNGELIATTVEHERNSRQHTG